MQQNITISGVTIKTPSKVTIERYNLTKSGRVSSGLMTMDLVAKKVKLLLHYDSISGTERKKILDLIDSNVMFFPVTYIDNNVVKTAMCYNGDVSDKVFRTGAEWYYEDVEYHLIEQ